MAELSGLGGVRGGHTSGDGGADGDGVRGGPPRTVEGDRGDTAGAGISRGVAGPRRGGGGQSSADFHHLTIWAYPRLKAVNIQIRP